MNESKLYNRIVSDDNIYLAIYKLNSYVFEKDLLSNSDIKLFYALQDKFNSRLIKGVIEKVKSIIEGILLNDELFEAKVFLRPKKLDGDTVIFRPLHTANLYSQIAMVALFNGLIYDEITTKDGKSHSIKLNELSKLIPGNFYGNIISDKGNELYVPWQHQYSKYSKHVTNAYYQYANNGEYHYEINLDIKDYFPSVDPGFVYALISKKVAFKYQGNEKGCFEKVLFKLLHFRLEPLNGYAEKYYGKEANGKGQEGFCKGIPQGLPISYFCGNIIMTEISKIFETHFPGEAYYYVDDSVIYTNKIIKASKFKETINCINKEINTLYETEIESLKYPESIRSIHGIESFQKYHSSKITVYDSEKSGFSEINSIKTGQVNLSALSRLASTGAKELLNTFSDSDNITLLNKFRALVSSIGAERRHIKSIIYKDNIKADKFSYYLKMLNRFYKFFQFRVMLLEDKESLSTPAERVKEVIEVLRLNDVNILDNYFSECDESIFSAKFMYVARNIVQTDDFHNLKDALTNFDLNVFINGKDIEDISYFARLLSAIEFKATLPQKSNVIYHSLTGDIKRKLDNSRLLTNSARITYAKEILEHLSFKDNRVTYIPVNGNPLDFVEDIPCNFVLQLTDELQRIVLNALISIILNIEVDNYATPYKLGNSPITYFELRTITYIRNNNFKLITFKEFLSKFNYCDSSIIDYDIFRVLDSFRAYVKFPEMIDGLIQVHKYTVDMWKHGSKFLHFYTLHNQAHAIELIKATNKLNKSIDYLQITNLDYYILFISCYLHDISMVIYPKISDVFQSKNNSKSNLIYSEFKIALHKQQFNLYFIQDELLRELLISYYKKIDAFFEDHVRTTHARDSGTHIRKAKDLTFITDEIKDIVAEITEAHGYFPKDIYGVKSVAKDSLVSKKFLKIFLRMSDLLDMSEERVTDTILQNNIDHMSPITQFHWLSHSIIAGYDIETEYCNKRIKEKLSENESYLYHGAIKETIIFKIKLNIKHWENMPPGECAHKSLVSNDKENNKLTLEIKNHHTEDIIEDNSPICADECNFICKWMSKKNEYLFEELYELQKYLRRLNQVSYFDTKIKVEFQMEDKNELDQKYYDIINSHISSH